MRIRRKHKQPGMPPSKVEALGRLSPAEMVSLEIKVPVGMPPVKVEAQQDQVRPVAGDGAFRAGAGAVRTKPVQKPPLLIGGESPQGDTTRESPSEREFFDSIVLDRNQNPVIRPGVLCINGQKVGIDWVSCVFEPSASWMYFFVSAMDGSVQEHESDDLRIAEYVRDIFSWILGFKKSDETNRWKIYENGINGYRYAIGMPFKAGVVHVGHTSKTVLVTVTGQGAMVAAPGWQHRLHQFLTDVKGWLTRVDMAYDDYEGQLFPVRTMREQAKEGAFARGGRPPKIELRGPWEQDDPTNSGLTLYVGARMSGKYTRIYEKGKQLGDEQSPWVRAEVELHNSCYQLTLDMLLKPTNWFVAFYPAFEVIERGEDRRELEYRTKNAIATIEHSVKVVRHQFGGHLAGLRRLYTDTELLDMLVRPDAVPEIFKIADKALETVLAPSASLTDEPGWIEA